MKDLTQNTIFTIGLPHIGPYSYLIKRVVNDFLKKFKINDIRLEVSPPITKKTINRGSQYMDENMCLPAKIVLGNILEMADRKIPVVLEWDNCGQCRQKTYGLIHQSILRQLGVSIKVIPIQARRLIKGLVEAVPQISFSQWKVIIRELFRAIWRHDLELMRKQAKGFSDKPKIGICGEIYTVLEPGANFELIKRLKEQGVYIHNMCSLSQFLFGSLFPGGSKIRKIKWLFVMLYLRMWREIWDWARGRIRRPDINYELMERAEKETHRYLKKHAVGGHGRESVVWTIYYALAGFDGVVHIMPFPCMPEATVSVLLDEISKDYGISVNHLVFDQQFGEQNLITRAEAMANLLCFKKSGIASLLKTRKEGLWLGVDVGSTSTKAVLLNGKTLEIVDSEYQFSHREPIETLKKVIVALLARNRKKEIKGMATTGSGRRLAQALLSAPLAIDEISCQTIGCLLTNSNVRSIIEIGGQDSKFIKLDQFGIPNWFNMNSICSAGTGAFLSSAAREFKVPIEQLGACAQSAACTVSITGRCGVFAEADIVSKQQAGYPKEGIIRGMCEALAKNYLSNLCRSQKLEKPVMFTGGVALNSGVVQAFNDLLKTKVLIHPYAKVSGAIGAGFLAMAKSGIGGLFEEDFIKKAKFKSQTFTCYDCANECEVSLICRNEKIIAAFGSRCGKYNAMVGKEVEEPSKKLNNTFKFVPNKTS